jgi:hypothetical protein
MNQPQGSQPVRPRDTNTIANRQSKSHAELTETDDFRPYPLNVRPPLGVVKRVDLNLQDVAGLSTPYLSS